MSQLVTQLGPIAALVAILALVAVNVPWGKLRRVTNNPAASTSEPSPAPPWPVGREAPPEFSAYVAAIEEQCAGMAAGDVLCVVASGISPRAAAVVKAVHG